MPIDASSIQDPDSTIPPNSEVVPADDDAPAKEDTSGLPTEILELPIFAGILSGAPAALWTPTGDKSPESRAAVKNQKALADTGIFLYRDKSSGLDLIFNAQFISKELIDSAAKKGKLKDVASPLTETVAAFNGTGAAPEGVSAPSAGGSPSPVPVDSALNTARVGNLSPGGPTSGPNPGAGRVLNGILTQTV